MWTLRSRGLYRRVMSVFVVNKRRFVVQLRPEDVAEALRQDGGLAVAQEQVEGALKSLEDWGNLRPTRTPAGSALNAHKTYGSVLGAIETTHGEESAAQVAAALFARLR
jgi:Protein of unknown function (DUF2397)